MVKMALEENEMHLRVRRKVTEELYTKLYEPPSDHDDEAAKKLQGPKKKQSPYSIQNLLWIVAALAVIYYTDFFNSILTHPKIKPTWFYLGTSLICVNLSIAAFLIVYLSYVKKVPSDLWEQHYPAAIPIATACFAFGSFCVTVGLWPIWSFLTPFILFTIFMGLVVIVAMLPNF